MNNDINQTSVIDIYGNRINITEVVNEMNNWALRDNDQNRRQILQTPVTELNWTQRNTPYYEVNAFFRYDQRHNFEQFIVSDDLSDDLSDDGTEHYVELYKCAFTEKCNISSCISCKYIDQMLNDIKQITDDDYKEHVISDIIDLSLTIFENITDMSQQFMMGHLDDLNMIHIRHEYTEFLDKYGVDITNQSQSIIFSRFTCIALDYQSHILPSVRKLLNENKITMNQVIDLNINTYELSDFFDNVTSLSSGQILRQNNEKTTCSICLEENNNEMSTTLCDHVFHTECINKWFETNRQCPLCRYEH